jgi:hypothetical protein
MSSHPALPLTPGDRARLRALHLADQAAAARRDRLHGTASAAMLAVALLLLVLFVVSGGYSLAAAHGMVPAAAWSALGAG